MTCGHQTTKMGAAKIHNTDSSIVVEVFIMLISRKKSLILDVCGTVIFTLLAVAIFHVVIPPLPPGYPPFGIAGYIESALFIILWPFGICEAASMMWHVMMYGTWSVILISMMLFHFLVLPELAWEKIRVRIECGDERHQTVRANIGDQ